MYCFLSGGYGFGGGAQTIQISLFISLTKKGEKCKLFDVDGGSVYKSFIEIGLPFEFIEIDKPNSKKDYSKFLNAEDLLIVFDTNFFGNLLYFSKSNCKILVWEIFFPWVERFIYTRYFPIKWWAQEQETKIISKIVKNNAFFFIDYLGKEKVEKRLKISISNSFYLPIPIYVPSQNNYINKKIRNSKFVVSYVGRSVDWKINPAVKIIEDFTLLNSNIQKEFHIICDNINIFKSKLEQKIPIIKNISIIYYEKLTLKELDCVLAESDLHFAMGTAALDGAKLGVPTILIDASYEDFTKNYKYRWIYETKKLNLGNVIKKNDICFYGKHSLPEILTSLKKNKSTISINCFEYVKKNYDVDEITKKIINYKKTAKLTFDLFKNMFTTNYFKFLRKIGVK